MPPDASTPTKSAPRTWRRKLAYSFIALATGILLLSVLARRTPDAVRIQIDAIRAAGEPIDAASLATWISPVPDSENGAPKLLERIDGFRGVNRGKIPERARSWDAATLSWAAAERTRLQSWRNDIHTALQAPRFRYPLVFTNGLAAIGNDHGEQIMLASEALAFWAAHSAVLNQEHPSAEALLDGLRLARTLDDDPIFMSWIYRMVCLWITLGASENALTLTPLPDAQLAELQAAFLDAHQPGSLTRALMSERILGLEMCQASPGVYLQSTLAPAGTPFGSSTREWAVAHLAQTAYQLSGAQGSDAAYYLQTVRELINISRLSGPARLNALLTLENRFDSESDRWNRHRSRATARNLFGVIRQDDRLATLLRSASVACAIERFRNAHQGQLPASLTELVPAFLPAIPIDPPTDQPLRFRPLNPGYIVYGLGTDGEDNQGNTTGKPGTRNAKTDVGFTVER
jgi:hypothetical protein